MESIAVMKGLWTEDSFTFEGEFFKFPPVRSGPRPLTELHPPIWLGGFSDAVLKRIGEHCNGWIPVYHNDQVAFGEGSGPENVKKSRAKLHQFAEAAGREVRHLAISAILTPESELGRAHDGTPVTNAQLECRILIKQKPNSKQ